jgi:fermentation-respiration switch protein FrsA (DUF1100 family)
VRWLLLLLFALNAGFYLQQPKMIFFPSRGLEATPAEWGLPFEEVALQTEDAVRLHGWYLPHPTATRTLLFFHGNGGNISHRGESLEIFHRLGLNVLIIDYRGYGLSAGTPDEAGLYRDAMAAWRYLTVQRGVAPRQILLFGRSLGGAVATQLASQVTPGALILESTFSSAADMGAQLFPWLSKVIWLRYRFDSVAAIRQLQSPLLLAHSADDEIIPLQLGQRLYVAAPAPKRFLALRGDHNSGFLQSQPAYESGLGEFIGALEAAGGKR